MKADIDYNSFPAGFVHCLNEKCLRGEECLRRQMALRIPPENSHVVVVNPGFIGDSSGKECRLFLLDQPLLYAQGITHLFDNLPYRAALSIKSQMLSHFGRSNYYRYYRKERLLSPDDQQLIQQMFRNQNLTEEPQFDAYVEYYDLG